MEYRIDKQGLLDTLSAWNGFLKMLKEFSHLYMKAKGASIDISRLIERFRETALYDVAEEKVNKNLDHFLVLLKKEGFSI